MGDSRNLSLFSTERKCWLLPYSDTTRTVHRFDKRVMLSRKTFKRSHYLPDVVDE